MNGSRCQLSGMFRKLTVLELTKLLKPTSVTLANPNLPTYMFCTYMQVIGYGVYWLVAKEYW